MNLRTFDLNLLVVLRALVEECSVSRAGQRLGLSQSATSHALGRLRQALGDELLVRTASGMEPTPRALHLAGQVSTILDDVEATFAPDAFRPAEETRRFEVMVESYETIVILAGLVDRVRQEAPLVDIAFRSASATVIAEEIDKGGADIAIGGFADVGDRFMSCGLLQERYVCVMRADHPAARAPLSLSDVLALPHLAVSISGGRRDHVDEVLAAAGHARRIAFTLPNGLAAAIALSRSDMIAVVTAGAARMFAAAAPLAILEPPLPVPPAEFRLIWHRRLQGNAAHQWLRRTLVAVGAAAMSSVEASG